MLPVFTLNGLRDIESFVDHSLLCFFLENIYEKLPFPSSVLILLGLSFVHIFLPIKTSGRVSYLPLLWVSSPLQAIVFSLDKDCKRCVCRHSLVQKGQMVKSPAILVFMNRNLIPALLSFAVFLSPSGKPRPVTFHW